MPRHFASLFAVVTLAAAACSSPEPAGVLFTDVTLIEPDGAAATPQDILVLDGIVRTADGDQVPAQTVDAAGKYLHAGLADAHVHLPDSSLWERTFLLHLLNGVTSLRSMRGEMWHADYDTSGALAPRLYLGSPPIVARDSAVDVDSLLAAYAAADFFLREGAVGGQRRTLRRARRGQQRPRHPAGRSLPRQRRHGPRARQRPLREL